MDEVLQRREPDRVIQRREVFDMVGCIGVRALVMLSRLARERQRIEDLRMSDRGAQGALVIDELASITADVDVLLKDWMEMGELTARRDGAA